MHLAENPRANATIFLLAFLSVTSFAQVPDPSPNASPTASTSDKTKSETGVAPDSQEAKPAATPEPEAVVTAELDGDRTVRALLRETSDMINIKSNSRHSCVMKRKQTMHAIPKRGES